MTEHRDVAMDTHPISCAEYAFETHFTTTLLTINSAQKPRLHSVVTRIQLLGSVSRKPHGILLIYKDTKSDHQKWDAAARIPLVT